MYGVSRSGVSTFVAAVHYVHKPITTTPVIEMCHIVISVLIRCIVNYTHSIVY